MTIAPDEPTITDETDSPPDPMVTAQRVKRLDELRAAEAQRRAPKAPEVQSVPLAHLGPDEESTARAACKRAGASFDELAPILALRSDGVVVAVGEVPRWPRDATPPRSLEHGTLLLDDNELTDFVLAAAEVRAVPVADFVEARKELGARRGEVLRRIAERQRLAAEQQADEKRRESEAAVEQNRRDRWGKRDLIERALVRASERTDSVGDVARVLVEALQDERRAGSPPESFR